MFELAKPEPAHLHRQHAEENHRHLADQKLSGAIVRRVNELDEVFVWGLMGPPSKLSRLNVDENAARYASKLPAPEKPAILARSPIIAKRRSKVEFCSREPTLHSPHLACPQREPPGFPPKRPHAPAK